MPVALAPGNDCTIRLCVDHEKLNAVFGSDLYSLTKTDEGIGSLENGQAWLALSAISDDWQIEVQDSNVVEMLFTSQLGAYQFIHMPLGLKNYLATFQRTIEKNCPPSNFSLRLSTLTM